MKRSTLRLRLVGLTLVGLAGCSGVSAQLGLQAFVIAGPAMNPTLLHGDRVFVETARRGWVPQPGDVVVARSPADDNDIVKRVVGVPGDTVETREDVLFRNGRSTAVGTAEVITDANGQEQREVTEQVGEHRYRSWVSPVSRRDSFAPTRVPDGHVFLLGDRRDRSNDSRNPHLGFVPLDRIRGRVVSIRVSIDREGNSRPERAGQAVN